MGVTLREISGANRESVLGLRVATEQQRFVGSVAQALAEAAEYPEAKPWYRAVYAGDEPVGFVMLSWDVPPRPPEIIGPWYLWKLLIDHRRQGQGYGAVAVGEVARLIRAAGAAELLTSYVAAEDGPAGFYARLGFVPTGDVDSSGEIVVRLALR
jgi:diamine N-acetyltransferase